MSEVEEKTEFKTGEKSLAGRDEKGLFQPGCAPGPGRGKKKNDIELTGELLSDIEAVVLAAMGDSDTGLRLKAAALAVKLQNLKKSADYAGPIMEPWVEKLMAFLNDLARRYFHRTGQSASALEMVDLLPRLCSDCEILGGPASDFKVVEDDD